MSLKHHDRSQIKWKVNSRDAKKIKKYKKGRALCVHLGFVPHHILEPTKNLNHYKDSHFQ
jgi:hypothetical protein